MPLPIIRLHDHRPTKSERYPLRRGNCPSAMKHRFVRPITLREVECESATLASWIDLPDHYNTTRGQR